MPKVLPTPQPAVWIWQFRGEGFSWFNQDLIALQYIQPPIPGREIFALMQKDI
jgi:hypothetical protein